MFVTVPQPIAVIVLPVAVGLGAGALRPAALCDASFTPPAKTCHSGSYSPAAAKSVCLLLPMVELAASLPGKTANLRESTRIASLSTASSPAYRGTPRLAWEGEEVCLGAGA